MLYYDKDIMQQTNLISKIVLEAESPIPEICKHVLLEIINKEYTCDPRYENILKNLKKNTLEPYIIHVLYNMNNDIHISKKKSIILSDLRSDNG